MEEADAPNVVEWRNRPDAARWLVQWERLTIEHHLQWFSKARFRELLFIFEDPTGTVLGTGNFYTFDRKGKTAEWGRLVSAGNLGNPSGLLEGGYLAHRIAFDLIGMDRTYCGVAEANSSSRKYAEFLGYQQEGVRRCHLVTPNGTYTIVEYGMLPDEFRERSAYLEKTFYRGKPVPDFTDEGREAAQEFRRQFST
jgi:RimJ/RimL family protein N-acetyltransferase